MRANSDHDPQASSEAAAKTRARPAATGQIADHTSRAATQRKLQQGADSSPQSAQLEAIDSSIRQSPAQRYPIPLNPDDEDGPHNDTKFPWMRMIPRPDLGPNTLELLQLDGAPSGSLMIWEQETDQYRFSPDGESFDDAQFPPHFMEEITGDATVDDQTEELYSYVGEYGVGYRPAEGMHATLEMSGFNACIGFVLECEGAAFCCHMVVGNQAPQDEGHLQDQVNALADKFAAQAGMPATICTLYYSPANYAAGGPAWINWLAPVGIQTQVQALKRDPVIATTGQLAHVPSVMWRGNAIRY